MLPSVMALGQWAPWVSVFLGGCLSGAALLSLSTDRVPESKTVTAPPQEPSTPAEPVDEHPAEAPDEAQADVLAHRDRATDTSDSEPEHPGDEAGPSAADVLAELERAYQLQVAAAAAAPPAPEAALADDAAAESEVVPPEVNPPASPNSAPEEVSAAVEEAPRDRRVALAEDEDEDEDETYSRDADPEESRRPDDLDRSEVQQVAVIYQPVYVLPPVATAAQPSAAVSGSRPIGLDPWTGLSVGVQHNPWATTPMSSSAWAAIGISGGSWSAGFVSRP